jgi:uncharacterized damage-inducible protein DinB
MDWERKAMKLSQMFSHWEQVRADLFATMEKFRDDELTYVPFPDAWPVGQVMLHIANCENFWIHGLVRGVTGTHTSYPLADYPTRAAIQEVLEQTHRPTVAFLDSLNEHDLERSFRTSEGESFTLQWIIWHVLEHEIHHRGELSLILGTLGRSGLDV